jgi:hypothetical protein
MKTNRLSFYYFSRRKCVEDKKEKMVSFFTLKKIDGSKVVFFA